MIRLQLTLSVQIGLLLFTVNSHANQCISFIDKSVTNLPDDFEIATMDAEAVDIENDGDLDIVLAIEHGYNLILINDGSGNFQSEPMVISKNKHDSEDIAVADFNDDGFNDLIIVSEDDKTNEYFLNNGEGHFIDVSDRIPVDGVSNSVVHADLTNNGSIDIIIGNAGQNIFLTNIGDGMFIDDTEKRIIGMNQEITQDLHLVDINQDGNLDLLAANEGQNRLYINDGNGVFHDKTGKYFPRRIDESREVVASDFDQDNDIDIYFSNVNFSLRKSAADTVYIKNKDTVFDVKTVDDETLGNGNNFTVGLLDVNQDGYDDVLSGSSSIFNRTPGRAYVLLNNRKNGFIYDESCRVFDNPVNINAFDFVLADFNNDGIQDMYVAGRSSQLKTGGSDKLFIGNRNISDG